MKTINNQVKLIGNLGRDIQIMDFKSGSKKAQGSLATNESTKNEKGEYVDNTQWHTLISWGKTAEMMSTILRKGDKVAITGSIKYRTYENRDGVSKEVTEIYVHEFLKVADGVQSFAKKEEVNEELALA